jgi:hypothetical protein
MTMLEPTTTITDFILAALSFYYGHMLYRFHARSGNKDALNRRYDEFWGIFFLFLGIGSLLGGVAHGFINLKGSYPVLVKAWPFTVMNLGFASFYLLLIIALEYFPRQRGILSFIAYFKMLAFFLLMYGYPKKYFGDFDNVSFKLVLFDYGPVLFLLLIMNLWDFIKTKSSAAKLMCMSVLVSIIGSCVQASGYTIHPQFNHNDLYHVISMFSLYLMYKAVTLKQLN